MCNQTIYPYFRSSATMASTPPTHFTKFVEYSAKKKKNKLSFKFLVFLSLTVLNFVSVKMICIWKCSQGLNWWSCLDVKEKNTMIILIMHVTHCFVLQHRPRWHSRSPSHCPWSQYICWHWYNVTWRDQ